ncbi:hypothetical protein [Pedobacter sp. NJ-S-72]
MELKILGINKDGSESLILISDDKFGYNIKCVDGSGTLYFNNIKKIEWSNQGKKVVVVPFEFPQDAFNKDTFNLTRFAEVDISKAEKTAADVFTNIYHSEDEMIRFKKKHIINKDPMLINKYCLNHKS